MPTPCTRICAAPISQAPTWPQPICAKPIFMRRSSAARRTAARSCRMGRRRLDEASVGAVGRNKRKRIARYGPCAQPAKALSLSQLINLHPCGALELSLRQLGRQLRIVAALARLAEQVDADHDPPTGGGIVALAHALEKQPADLAFAFGERHGVATLRAINLETRGPGRAQ